MMSHDSFDFKQFSIVQDHCAMKVGTDGVLLGAWVDIRDFEQTKNVAHVLDIGTGTGLISLMLAQRLSRDCKECLIDALEIDAEAAQQAQENTQNSPWSKLIHIIPESLQEYKNSIESIEKKYDLIVSNPPFYNATLKPEDEARAVARHKDSLPLSEITSFAKDHLTDHGTLSLIYPTSYDTEVMTATTLSGLHPITICDVVTKKGKPCKRRMATFALSTHPKKDIERQILYIRDEEGQYAEEYLALVRDFYIKL